MNVLIIVPVFVSFFTFPTFLEVWFVYDLCIGMPVGWNVNLVPFIAGSVVEHSTVIIIIVSSRYSSSGLKIRSHCNRCHPKMVIVIADLKWNLDGQCLADVLLAEEGTWWREHPKRNNTISINNTPTWIDVDFLWGNLFVPLTQNYRHLNIRKAAF